MWRKSGFPCRSHSWECVMFEQRCKGPFRGGNPDLMCHQLLFRFSTAGQVEVKCPRCKTVTRTQVTRLSVYSYAS